ncbi:glycosyltransferase family 4 protein [Micrococcus luteus]
MNPTPARLAANALLALTTASDHLRDDPVVLALQISRRMPPGVRSRLGRLGERLGDRGPLLPAAVALAAGGRVDSLRRLVAQAVEEPRTRGVDPTARVRLADVLLAAEDSDRAEALLASTSPATPGWREARARLHWHRGAMQQAVSVLGGRGRREQAVRRRLATELNALQGWTPSLHEASAGYRPVPKRVLFVLTNSLPHTGSGYAQRSHSLMTAVHDCGWDPEAVTRLGWPVQTGVLDAAGEDVVDGIRYHRLLAPRLVPGFDARLQQHSEALLDLVLDRRPTVLHTTTHWVNAVVVRAVAEAVGIPWVYEVRGQLADTWASTRGLRALDSERYRLFVQREADAVRSADAVVTLAETMRRRVAEDGVDAEDILLSPNAVGGAFLEAPLSVREARERLGLDPDDEYVGTVSSVVPYEGLDDLVRAVARLAPERPRLRLLIAGDGTALPGLRQLAAELGILDRLLTPGRVDRSLAPVYHQALDVFCVPRKDTSVTRSVTPMKPLEAMASGRAVALSDLPALREIVDTDVTGVLLPAEDPGAWARGLTALLDAPELREGLGTRARDWVLAHRTWAANARRYADKYAEITASPPGRH